MSAPISDPIRATAPRLGIEDYQAAAETAGVCTRPVLQKVTNTHTGHSQIIAIPCGHTRANRCTPCAEKARRLRMQQCREGWHRLDEPAADDPCTDEQADDEENTGDEPSRRIRSTRRRQDAPDLPRVPMDDRTVGAVFTTPEGKTYRPSMFLTLTLPSYGRVHGDGTPLDPTRYDYRRAALDALHVGKLIDRFWQNTRRCAGFHVQYFATIEPQRRLAPHLHAAIRGVLPRAVMRQIVAATYVQIWWPSVDHIAYTPTDAQPAWDPAACRYVDPTTGDRLLSWDAALDEIDNNPDARPMHVSRFGSQIDMQGILAGSPDAERSIGYLTKYLAKSMDASMGDESATDRQQRHTDRLLDELRWLPCSAKCANWLQHGIEPKDPDPGLVAGQCGNKAHDADHLGYSGRRVLVSRKWTGKTLTDHRADRAAVVRATLESAGIDIDDHHELAATAHGDENNDGVVWTRVDPRDVDAPSYGRAIAASITRAHRWRAEYEHAKTRAGPPVSAIQQTTAA